MSFETLIDAAPPERREAVARVMARLASLREVTPDDPLLVVAEALAVFASVGSHSSMELTRKLDVAAGPLAEAIGELAQVIDAAQAEAKDDRENGAQLAREGAQSLAGVVEVGRALVRHLEATGGKLVAVMEKSLGPAAEALLQKAETRIRSSVESERGEIKAIVTEVRTIASDIRDVARLSLWKTTCLCVVVCLSAGGGGGYFLGRGLAGPRPPEFLTTLINEGGIVTVQDDVLYLKPPAGQPAVIENQGFAKIPLKKAKPTP